MIQTAMQSGKVKNKYQTKRGKKKWSERRERTPFDGGVDLQYSAVQSDLTYGTTPRLDTSIDHFVRLSCAHHYKRGQDIPANPGSTQLYSTQTFCICQTEFHGPVMVFAHTITSLYVM